MTREMKYHSVNNSYTVNKKGKPAYSSTGFLVCVILPVVCSLLITFSLFMSSTSFNTVVDSISYNSTMKQPSYTVKIKEDENYNNKTIKLKGMVYNKDEFPAGSFVLGRMAMTCCEDDISFVAVVSKYEKSKELKHDSWVTVTAKVKYEFNKEYQEDLPVLFVEKVEEATEPQEKIVYFG